MTLFRLKLVNIVISITLLKCLADARNAFAKESKQDILNSYLNEIKEDNARTELLYRTKRELRQMKSKIGHMVFEIERTRRERFNSEELFWNVEKRYENDLLRLAQRRLRRNRNKIDKLDKQLDEIKYSNNLGFKRNRDLLLNSYKVDFVESAKKHRNLNRLLVKRKVPRNVASPKFEYDQALKTLYRPLFRLHTSESDNDSTRSNYRVKTPKRFLRADKKVIKHLVQDITNLIPKSSEDPIGINRAIKKLISQNKILRQNEEPSGPSVEIDDPYAPGKHTYDNVIKEEHHPTTTTKAPFWYPEYNFYDFWTYNKSIMQDECPPNQIKLRNLCIAAPPH